MSGEVIDFRTCAEYLALAREEAEAGDAEGVKLATMLVDQAWHFGRQAANLRFRTDMNVGTAEKVWEHAPPPPTTAHREGSRRA